MTEDRVTSGVNRSLGIEAARFRGGVSISGRRSITTVPPDETSILSVFAGSAALADCAVAVMIQKLPIVSVSNLKLFLTVMLVVP